MKNRSKISKEKTQQYYEDYDYELFQDTRNAYHKGNFSYSAKNLVRVNYIKEKKEKQRQDQIQDSLYKFQAMIKEEGKNQ
jgi:hypothetical protein